MKWFIRILTMPLFICFWFTAPAVADEKDPDIIVNKSRLVIEEMMLSEHKEVPEDLIKKCAGLAIVPGMIKGGFFVGGSYGEGIVLAYRDGKWTGPAFIYIGAGSIGLQIGAGAIDLVLVVVGRKAMDAFMRSKFKLGADVTIAIGPYGGRASAATDITFKGGIYSYSRSRGLFAGVSFEGSGIGTLPGLNTIYYKTISKTEDILDGKAEPPASGQKLIEVLKKLK